MPRSALVLLLVGAAALRLCAQNTDASRTSKLAPGTRVRLTVDAGGDSALTIRPGRYVGTLRSVGADSVRVQLAGADAPESLPWTVVSRMDVSHGVNTPLKIVAMSVGAVGGGVLGALAADGLMTDECHTSGGIRECEEGGSDGVVLGTVGILVGAAAGAGLGKLVAGRERWTETVFPRRVIVRPWGGRSGMGIGVAFRVAL
jgi:hypothetical protein